uniref:SMC-Scp complex subunit ScpB n=1 Tax=uncultured Planctomycetota bacterium TaxID=120965 RepID=A0A1B0Z226_9BACT|nr:hypothetical protein [uncultured Planctomycetota bacterium]
MWQHSSRSWTSGGTRLRSGPHGDRHKQFFRQRGVEKDCLGEAPVEARRSQKLARLEAVLLVADSAMSPRRLAQLATLASPAEVGQLIERLNRIYDSGESAFHIERVATGFQLLTRPEFSMWLDRLHNRQVQLKLSTPALETLSIVAYRQPITRADIETIRGVQSTDILRHLMERGLVRIGGEEDSLGRPYLYETTRRFLELFGLTDLDDLPNAVLLRKPPVAMSAPVVVETDDSIVDEDQYDEDQYDEDQYDEDDDQWS